MPVQPSPAQSDVNPSESADRAEMSRLDLAVNLPALARDNPYLAYHRGWVHGYWNASFPNAWSRPTRGYSATEAASGKGPGSGPGMGLGWGLPAWVIGPMAYRWGYFRYDNPFHRGGPTLDADPPRADDYSRPISVLIPPPTESLLDDALLSFRAARDAFRREDYPRRPPPDRGCVTPDARRPDAASIPRLTHFALGRYDEAAATLHAVLAVCPGWDWITVNSLYRDRETYTRQLRLLEQYSDANSRAAAARFVRAYHYLTTGYAEEAVGQWEQVVALRPNDRLSAQMVLELQRFRQGNGDRPARTSSTPDTASTAAAAASSSHSGKLEGTWTAHPSPDTTITLTLQKRGPLVWKVSQPGRDREFEGHAIYEKETLTLSQNQDNALVGTVRWQDEGHFTFKILAGQQGDPGLTFARSG